jgi:murein DD-endopeptidase MepM/ murein hydrolase activator NlpD
VPAPHGPEAELAAQLGLGTLSTANYLLLEPAVPEWVQAAGSARDAALRWPVDGGHLGRGVDRAGRASQARPGRAQRSRHRRHRHLGIDIAAAEGSLIHAASSGIVAYADNGVRGYGNLLMIIHPDGSVAFYAHCRALYVFAGQHIVKGQIIGETGNTGITRGPHLHFEYRVDGEPRDPMPQFTDRPG